MYAKANSVTSKTKCLILVFKRSSSSKVQTSIIPEGKQTVLMVIKINIFSLVPVIAAVQRLVEDVGFCTE